MDQGPGGAPPGAVAGPGRAVAAAANSDLRHDLADLGFAAVTQIASGGFATVYRARQAAMGREVAVKVLTAPVTDALARSRFQRECQALGVLSDHPAIVTVYDAGFTASGHPYLVMELMSGGSLAQRLQAGGPLPWDEVLTVGVRIAGGLHSAHHHGVLHRDVKPANILVSEYGAPKLGDFGIARLQGAEHTRTGALTGSLAHAAPELLGGSAPSVRSDLYGLGSTLFTLLRGETAFLHPTDESIIPALARITTSAVPDLRIHGVPPEVCDVVEQLMAKRPEERPASAAEAGRMLQAVQRTLEVPVTVLPVPDDPAGDSPADVTPGRDAGAAGPPPVPWRRRLYVTGAVLGLLAAVGIATVLVRTLPTQPQGGQHTAPPAPATDVVSVDTTAVAADILQIRGLPLEGVLDAVVVAGREYDERIRAWSTAGRETNLEAEQRILATLHLIGPDMDLVAVTQDLYAEQFLGFYDGGQIVIRGDSSRLSALQRAVLADEVAGVLLERRHGAAPSGSASDVDARRAWRALLEGDTAVTAAAWSERFLDADEQRQRATELSGQPDHVARGLPDALRADLVFPYVAGEQFVRELFAEGGVAAIEQAYAAPPVTTEQLLHPDKYRRNEAAVPVRIPAEAPPGWTPLAEHSFGEFDLRRLTAALGPGRSAAAAAGWGGGQLRAWQRGDATAVRVSLVFDTRRDARQACTAVRDAHQQRSGAVPTSADVLRTPDDVFVMRCAGARVGIAVAPDQAMATDLVER